MSSDSLKPKRPVFKDEYEKKCKIIEAIAFAETLSNTFSEKSRELLAAQDQVALLTRERSKVHLKWKMETRVISELTTELRLLEQCGDRVEVKRNFYTKSHLGATMAFMSVVACPQKFNDVGSIIATRCLFKYKLELLKGELVPPKRKKQKIKSLLYTYKILLLRRRGNSFKATAKRLRLSYVRVLQLTKLTQRMFHDLNEYDRRPFCTYKILEKRPVLTDSL